MKDVSTLERQHVKTLKCVNENNSTGTIAAHALPQTQVAVSLTALAIGYVPYYERL